MESNSTIGNTRDAEYLRVIADITIKLANGSLTLESAKRYAKKENPFSRPEKLTVNGSDPRWKTITKSDYYYINSDLKVEHFPISNPGTREVEYEEITFDHEPTTQEILDTIEQRGLRRPERDEVETYLDNVPDTKEQLGKSPIVALCGSFVERVGGRSVACVYAYGSGRGLYFRRLGGRWARQFRFLAVRK